MADQSRGLKEALESLARAYGRAAETHDRTASVLAENGKAERAEWHRSAAAEDRKRQQAALDALNEMV